MAGNHSKLTKEATERLKLEYLEGNYKTLDELAERYGLKPSSLRTKICDHNWHQEREEMQRTLSSKVRLVKEDLTETYLTNHFKRVLRYEKIIDASQQNLGSKDENGLPLLDPDAISSYTISEVRLHEMAKSALRIPDVQKALDITSKGQSIGESLFDALKRLRETPVEVTPLTEKEIEILVEAEIVDEVEPKRESEI